VSGDGRTCSPWWSVDGGRFRPFEVREQDLSEEAAVLVEAVRARALPGSVYLRGSIVESLAPFAGSDVDLLVCADDVLRTVDLAGLTERPLDLKILPTRRVADDLVQRALLTHRSLHVSGPRLHLVPVSADSDFAWAHWLASLPAGLPARIDTRAPGALLVLKRAARAFGVIALLREGRYTRDIGACIGFASEAAPEAADVLRVLRTALETGTQAEVSLVSVRSALRRLHASCEQPVG
jgi:hypothetical protein